MSLPANSCSHPLVYKPRKMTPFHSEGEGWSIDLIMVPMKSVRSVIHRDSNRSIFSFKRVGTEEGCKNLETWLRNLGNALYNPLFWEVKNNAIEYKHGNHRLRALEALDFDFVYVYLKTGNSIEKWRGSITINDMPPELNERLISCHSCGRLAKWISKNDCTIPMTYKCLNCEHTQTVPPIYPEPI